MGIPNQTSGGDYDRSTADQMWVEREDARQEQADELYFGAERPHSTAATDRGTGEQAESWAEPISDVTDGDRDAIVGPDGEEILHDHHGLADLQYAPQTDASALRPDDGVREVGSGGLRLADGADGSGASDRAPYLDEFHLPHADGDGFETLDHSDTLEERYGEDTEIFSDGTRDIESMTQWVFAMDHRLTFARRRGWLAASNLLAGVARTLRARGEALAQAWDSSADGASASGIFMEQIGRSLISLDEWSEIAGDNAGALLTIGQEIRRAQEELGPIYAHYQVARSLLAQWETLQEHEQEIIYDTSDMSLVDRLPFQPPPPGIVDYDYQYRPDQNGDMRINDPDDPMWDSSLPVLYNRDRVSAADIPVGDEERLKRAYHNQAAAVVQRLADTYTNAHYHAVNQGLQFGGPTFTQLGLPQPQLPSEDYLEQYAQQQQAEIDALLANAPGPGGGGGGGVPDVAMPASVQVDPTTGMPTGPGSINLPGIAAAPGVPGMPAAAGLSPDAGGGHLAGLPLARLASPGPSAAAAWPVLPQPATGLPPPGAPPVPPPIAVPGGAPGALAPGGVAAPGAVGVPGSAPASTAPGTTPVGSPGTAQPPGTAQSHGTPALPGAATGTAPGTEAAAPGRPGMMPPPMMPPATRPPATPGGKPVGGRPGGPATGQSPAAPLFVPPGRVNRGTTPTAPQPVAPTLGGSGTARAAGRVGRAAGRVAGVRGRRASTGGAGDQQPGAGQQSQPPEPQQSQQSAAAGQDREIWEVPKPKGVLKGSGPQQPARHGKALGSAG